MYIHILHVYISERSGKFDYDVIQSKNSYEIGDLVVTRVPDNEPDSDYKFYKSWYRGKIINYKNNNDECLYTIKYTDNDVHDDICEEWIRPSSLEDTNNVCNS